MATLIELKSTVVEPTVTVEEVRAPGADDVDLVSLQVGRKSGVSASECGAWVFSFSPGEHLPDAASARYITYLANNSSHFRTHMIGASSSTSCTIVFTSTVTDSEPAAPSSPSDSTTMLLDSPNTSGGMSSTRRVGFLICCNSSIKRAGLESDMAMLAHQTPHFLHVVATTCRLTVKPLLISRLGSHYLRYPHLRIFFKLDFEVRKSGGQAGQYSVGCLRDLRSAWGGYASELIQDLLLDDFLQQKPHLQQGQ